MPTNDACVFERLDQPTAERFMDALSAEQRRAVIDYLDEGPSPVALADLTRAVAGHLSESDGSQSVDERRVHLSLHHCHIPKLDEATVVNYDPDRGTVEPASEFETAIELLEAVSGAPE